MTPNPPSRGSRAACGVAALALFLLLWSLAARLADRPFLPGPLSTVRAFGALAREGRLGRNVLASARRVFLAVAAAFFPAAALGILAGRSRGLNALLSPVLYVFHPLPKVAFLPILFLVLGLGESAKIVLVGLVVFSQILVAGRDAARRIPQAYFDAVLSMGGSRSALSLHVVLPSVLPDLLTALRVSLGTAFAVLFFAETFASESGLGWLIVDSWSRVEYPGMYAAILALSLLGLASFLVVDIVERWVCRWRYGE